MNFSVLMSVYTGERAEYLNRALESILVNQTYKPSELIIVADGELTKDLYKTIYKYKKIYTNIIKLVQLPQNIGLGRALNEGLKYCSYDWVARMDSDDISVSNRFEKQVDYIIKNPNTDVLGAWISEFHDNPQDIESVRRTPESHSKILKYAQTRNPINHPVVFFNKNTVTQVGGYEHCPFFEDYWLWVRLLHNGAIFYNIQDSLLLFRANNSMYERRGGISYIRHEYAFLKKMRNIQFISNFTFLKNLLYRVGVRIIPNNIRVILYQKVLRK